MENLKFNGKIEISEPEKKSKKSEKFLLTQNLSPIWFWHAEAESAVKNLQILHPDLEMKENDLQKKNRKNHNFS